MITSNDFKTGMVIRTDNRMAKIIEFLHVKPGKGSAFVRTKIKDMITGQVLSKTFRAGEKVEDVWVEKRKMQYLYRDDQGYHFMDNENYEQLFFTKEQLGDTVNYLKENCDVDVQFCDGKPIGIEQPQIMEFEITHTEPGLKGDTVSNTTKPANIETGLEIQVPIFVNIGDRVKIDTYENKYLSRV